MSTSTFVSMASGIIIRDENLKSIRGLVRENSSVSNFTDEDSLSYDPHPFLFNVESSFRSRFSGLEPTVAYEEIPHPSGMFIFFARSTFTPLNNPKIGYRPFVFPQDLDKFAPNEEELASLEKLNNDIVIPSGSEALKLSPILWYSYS